MSAKAGHRQIAITVPVRVYDRVEAFARKAGQTTTGYTTLLFNAAYAARFAPTGDLDLDAAVGRVVVLWGVETANTAEIARHVGLSEATVVNILEAWRAEISGRAA